VDLKESGAPNAEIRRWTLAASPWVPLPPRPEQPRLAAALTETLDVVAQTLGGLPESTSIHLWIAARRARSERRDLPEGRACPANGHQAVGGGADWLLWHNAHKKKKFVWCTERRGRVVDFWVAFFSEVVIIVRRLIREGWTRYRWEGRPSRRP
jgi:hypothetical protein